MIQIIDYHLGNIHSLQTALDFLKYSSRIVVNLEDFSYEEPMILPGVGAFEPSIKLLKEKKFHTAIQKNLDKGNALLGICLGMQLLMQTSYERGCHSGLGLVKGEVIPFQCNKKQKFMKIPHMGWNQLHPSTHPYSDLFFPNRTAPFYCYFVHSYHVRLKDPSLVVSTTDYGYSFCSFFKKNNIYALQFHPEKSQKDGLHLLEKILSLMTPSFQK